MSSLYEPHSHAQSRYKNPRIISRLYKMIRHLDYTQLYRKQDIKSHEISILDRTLGVFDLIAYGISVTVGAGIFISIGLPYKTTGPSIIISLIFAAVSSFLSALCYAEFAARIPVAGSAYTFTYVVLGEFCASVVAWCLTLQYAVSAAAVARFWSASLEYGISHVGGVVPYWLRTIERNSFSFSPLAILLIVVSSFILLFGIRESARLNIGIMVFNVSTLCFFIIYGFFFFEPSHFQPFAIDGFSGIINTTATVFFSFIGFDGVTTLAAETKNPQKNMPLGIVGSLFSVTCLYLLVVISLIGLILPAQVNTSYPLAYAFKQVDKPWAVTLIIFAMITTFTATTFTTLVSQPRIFFQMAYDGLFFSWLTKVNAKKVPWASTVFSGALTVLVLFINANILVDFISNGTLVIFIIICSGILILRYQRGGKFIDMKDEPSTYSRLPFFEKYAKFISKHIIPLISSLWLGHIIIITSYLNNILLYILPLYTILIAVPIFSFAILTPNPQYHTFSCPLVPLVPILGIFTNFFILLNSRAESINALLLWIGFSCILYITYGFWFSKLRNKEIPASNTLPNGVQMQDH